MTQEEGSRSDYDLHLHTHWSYDAEIAPETYVKRAAELGMRCIAFTDHNNIDVSRDIERVASLQPQVRVVLGAELDVASPAGAHHILAYGFRESALSPRLKKLLELYRDRYRQQAACFCQNVRAQGVAFSEEDLRKILSQLRPEHAISVQGLTPMHLARENVQALFVQAGFLEEGRSARELAAGAAAPELPLPTADQVIPALKESGVLVAAAHPTVFWRSQGRVQIDFSVEHMDALRETFQFDGVECAHMPPDQQQACRAYCREHGLFSVAGTDLHRIAGEPFNLGVFGAANDWLDEFLERLEVR